MPPKSDPIPNLKRRDDGTLWQSSYHSEAKAMASLFNDKIPDYFFRQVEPNPDKKWWQWWKHDWIRTGKTWEGFNRDVFDQFESYKVVK